MSIFLKNYKKGIENNFIKYDYLLFLLYGNLIKKGKKIKAEKNLKELKLKLRKDYPNENILEIILLALNKIKPKISLKKKKIAGILYQLPFPITEKKSCKLAIRWFFKTINLRKENSFVQRMYKEIDELLKEKGISLQKKIFLEKVALDNRPFIFYLKR